MTRFVYLLVLIGFASCLSKEGPLPQHCSDPYGRPGQRECINGILKYCWCNPKSFWCYWQDSKESCEDSSASLKSLESDSSGGCSDSVDIPEELSNLLESDSSSCLLNTCNCIGRGNQIARRLASSFEDCDSICRASFPTCRFWTFVPQYKTSKMSYCYFLTNCNYIKCGSPFNQFVSGPRSCQMSGKKEKDLVGGSPDFSITNDIMYETVSGLASFGGSPGPKKCNRNYSPLSFGQSQGILTLQDCFPLSSVSATLGNNVQCDSFRPSNNGNPPFDNLKVIGNNTKCAVVSAKSGYNKQSQNLLTLYNYTPYGLNFNIEKNWPCSTTNGHVDANSPSYSSVGICLIKKVIVTSTNSPTQFKCEYRSSGTGYRNFVVCYDGNYKCTVCRPGQSYCCK